jgi:diadenosine tetraphosphate (Ap4A) HIT family hydrolase
VNTESCIFCNISTDKIHYETDEFIVFEDINKRDKYHYLICPKTHIENYFEDLSLYRKAIDVAYTMIHKLNLKSCQIIVNYKKPYQQIYHAHMHVIGFS